MIYTKEQLLAYVNQSKFPPMVRAMAALSLMHATDAQIAQISPYIERVLNAVQLQDSQAIRDVLKEVGLDAKTVNSVTHAINAATSK